MKKILLSLFSCAVAIAIYAQVPGGLTRINRTAYSISTSIPTLQNVTNNAIVTVFSANTALDVGRVLARTIQNNGTNAVLYLINSTNVSTTNYHGILAGCTAARDGLGSQLNASAIPFSISLITESGGSTVSLVELTQ